MKSKQAFFWFLAIFLVGLAFFLTIFLDVAAAVSYKRTDYNPTYFGLRAALDHQNPYSQALATRLQQMEIEDVPDITPQTLFEVGLPYSQPFAYPLAPSLVFLPFALLPAAQSAFVMRFVNLALYLLAIPLLLSAFVFTSANLETASKKKQNLILVTILLVIMGGPLLKVIWPIIQLSGTLLFLIALVIFCLYRKYYRWAGALSFVVLFKPQTGLPMLIIVLLFGLLFVEARWQLLKGLIITALPLSLLAFWCDPTWITDWLESASKLAANSKSYQINNLASLGLILGVVLALALISVNVWAWLLTRAKQKSLEGKFYSGLSLALTTWSGLILIPRTGNYDLIFCDVPLFFALSYFATSTSGKISRLAIPSILLAFIVYSSLYLLINRNDTFVIALITVGFVLSMVSLHYVVSKQPQMSEN